MMNIADPSWAWFKSVNFYLVLAFGFGTYMLWGFIYEAAIKEYEKKNVTRKTEVEIKAIQKQMEVLEAEIINCKKEICDLQKIIESLKVEIESLKNDLQKALSKPEEILRSIENFYSGWLQYLNAFSETDPRRTGCDNIYRSFHQSISTQLN